jgi:anaerobic magnesium-protoporphyrin IX monomethyl ester cyclase
MKAGKKIKKVLLITPPYHCGVVESAGTWLPLGLVYIAGTLRKAGYEVEIYDAMAKFHTHRDIATRIIESQPDVVGTGAYTATIIDALEILKTAKMINPSVVTVLGGVHPTFMADEVLKENHHFVDYIVQEEGEGTTLDLLEHIRAGKDLSMVKGISFFRERKVVSTPPRPFIKDLDSLTPAWDLVEWPIYTYRPHPGSTLAVVSSSRGCTQHCTFCSQQIFWKRTWRARNAESLISELEYLNKRFGVNVVMLTDEVPTLNRKRWERILDLLVNKDMDLEILMETRVDDILRDADLLDKCRQAKILHIYVGVESASQETLDRFHKNIKVEESRRAVELINQAGIISETSFVLGMPEETPESIRTTVELAKHYDPDLAFFLAIAPWPYSEIYPELRPYIEDFDYRKYNLVEPVVKPIAMTREELNRELLNAFRSFYMFKLGRLDQMSEMKRNYMIDVTQLLVKHSYLAEQMKSLAQQIKDVEEALPEMPPEVKKLLAL